MNSNESQHHSEPEDLMNQNGKIFVLVHGGAQRACAFEKVAWALTQDGHQVVARDLPGHGCGPASPAPTWNGPTIRIGSPPSHRPSQLSAQDYADEVIATISHLAERTPGRQIVLIGHSFAGLTLSRVGEAIPQLIHRLVYISAVMPAPGKSLFDYTTIPEAAASKIPAILIGDPQTTGALPIDFQSTDPGYQAHVKGSSEFGWG